MKWKWEWNNDDDDDAIEIDGIQIGMQADREGRKKEMQQMQLFIITNEQSLSPRSNANWKREKETKQRYTKQSQAEEGR